MKSYSLINLKDPSKLNPGLISSVSCHIILLVNPEDDPENFQAFKEVLTYNRLFDKAQVITMCQKNHSFVHYPDLHDFAIYKPMIIIDRTISSVAKMTRFRNEYDYHIHIRCPSFKNQILLQEKVDLWINGGFVRGAIHPQKCQV